MDAFLKEALELVKAQVSVRSMSEEEIIMMVRRLASNLRAIAESSEIALDEPAAEFQGDPRKSLKEKSVTCLECGKVFKIITRKHLGTHGLDAVSYREKWGLKKDTPLVCKSLQRERRKKMKEMKLWEKRRKVVAR